MAGNDYDPQGRRRWNVGAFKIPAHQRDVARSVMADDDDVAHRGYCNVLGGDDDPGSPTLDVGRVRQLRAAFRKRLNLDVDAELSVVMRVREVDELEAHGVTSSVYSLMLTDDEAQQFVAASNCRFVEPAIIAFRPPPRSLDPQPL